MPCSAEKENGNKIGLECAKGLIRSPRSSTQDSSTQDSSHHATPRMDTNDDEAVSIDSASKTSTLKPSGIDIKTWATKESSEFRSYSDFLVPKFWQDTVEHLRSRDWSMMVWRNVFYISLYHVYAAIGAYFVMTGSVCMLTMAWMVFCYYFSGVGVTAGMHRLWAHRSYKSSTALEVFLACGASMAFENSIYVWCRDHRVHHKYSETTGDPHDSQRGLFFSHIGWLLTRKHPDVARMGKSIDMDDLKKNQIVQFQHRYYLPCMLFWSFAFPSVVPVLVWGESLWTSFVVACLRMTFVHHGTWFVNSIAHWQGPHPYDDTIWPCENLLTGVVALGEGWHNYHHRFPNDYRTSDRDFGPWIFLFNFTQLFLDTSAKLGLCGDMIIAPPKLVESVKAKSGEGRWLKGEAPTQS
eukprot:GHVH01003685.1.p1 GENE.GHVH01003685.1~~GHVH01003685.1.p1  ORF type:complete len:410 (+),score=40.06 GHVH01003685.1:79-1308(+)